MKTIKDKFGLGIKSEELTIFDTNIKYVKKRVGENRYHMFEYEGIN